MVSTLHVTNCYFLIAGKMLACIVLFGLILEVAYQSFWHVKPVGIWLRPGLLAAYWVQLPLPWLKDFAKSGRSCDFLLQHLNGFIELMLDEVKLSCKGLKWAINCRTWYIRHSDFLSWSQFAMSKWYHGDYSISELQPGIERPWRFGSIKSCQMRCLYNDPQKKTRKQNRSKQFCLIWGEN